MVSKVLRLISVGNNGGTWGGLQHGSSGQEGGSKLDGDVGGMGGVDEQLNDWLNRLIISRGGSSGLTAAWERLGWL